MNLIRERPSYNGVLDCHVIQNIQSIQKTERNTKIGRFALKIKAERTHIVSFPTEIQRDSALSKIQCSTEAAVVLDFNEFFTLSIFTDEKALTLVPDKYRLSSHLRTCITEICKREKITLDTLVTRDAFRIFTVPELFKIKEETFTFNSSHIIPHIWSKCLFTPPVLVNKWGVTPLQFQKAIIINDKKNIINRSVHSSTDCV